MKARLEPFRMDGTMAATALNLTFAFPLLQIDYGYGAAVEIGSDAVADFVRVTFSHNYANVSRGGTGSVLGLASLLVERD
jgi:hypothetical protein